MKQSVKVQVNILNLRRSFEMLEKVKKQLFSLCCNIL